MRSSLRSASLRALALQLSLDSRPHWRELAWARATLGVLGDPAIPRFAGAALDALDCPSAKAQRVNFGWSWWFQCATNTVHSYQTERLTPDWCAAHVAGTPQLPAGGAVLLTVHHFNRRLAYVRFSCMVERLGMVSADGPAIDRAAQFYERMFDSRVFQPPYAARRGLRLLEQGGYLIITSDGFGQSPTRGQILGRQCSVEPGAVWLAEHAGKPIVPFVVAPDGAGWRLWCGEPVPAHRASIDKLLEECIRRAPTSWAWWPNWLAAPLARAS